MPPPADIWTGADAEKLCLTHQLDVLEAIQAPEHERAHCRQEMGGQYFNVPYEKRAW